MEEDGYSYLGKVTLTNIANKFCSIIEENGYGCSIYVNLNWINNYLNINDITTKDKLWLANWFKPSPKDYTKALSTIPNYDKTKYTLWQFSDDGRISGYNDALDLDIGYDIFD